MDNTLFKLTKNEYIQAKSWADCLLHNAPQTAMYFDKNFTLSEIIEKQNQLKTVSESGLSLQDIESLRFFKNNNIRNIVKYLRPSFNQYMGFAFKIRKCSDVNNAITPKVMHHYIKLLENMVHEGDITPDTFYEQISYMRILCSMATATDGFRDINIDNMTQKAVARVKEYLAKLENGIIDKNHSLKIYSDEEIAKIIDGVKDEKAKIALEVMNKTGLRTANIETMCLNTKWYREHHITRIVPTNENTVALLSMSTYKHTVTLPPELFAKLKKYADENNIFRINGDFIRKLAKESAKEQGFDDFYMPSIIATFANRLYHKLINEGYGDAVAKEMVAKKLHHRDTRLIDYYIAS